MADTQLGAFTIGQGKLLAVDHAGPKSYTTGGETLGSNNAMTGISMLGLAVIDNVLGSGNLSVSGSYWVVAQPTGKGERKTWKLLWFTATAGVPALTQVSSAVDLSAEVVKLGYVGR